MHSINNNEFSVAYIGLCPNVNIFSNIAHVKTKSLDRNRGYVMKESFYNPSLSTTILPFYS